jgi:hypothetical protein
MDLPPALEFRTKVQDREGAGYIEIEEDDDLALALEEQPALRGSPGSPGRTGGDPYSGGHPSASTISGVTSEGTLLNGMSNTGAGTGCLQHAKADDRYLPKLLGRLLTNHGKASRMGRGSFCVHLQLCAGTLG